MIFSITLLLGCLRAHADPIVEFSGATGLGVLAVPFWNRYSKMHKHRRKGVRVMREDNPATEVMRALSECIDACGMLCLLPTKAQRDAVLDAVSWFIEAAPLDDLPTVRSFGPVTKDMLRDGAAVAAKLHPLVLAWDGITEPPVSMVSLAHEFLVSIGMERVLENQRDAP